MAKNGQIFSDNFSQKTGINLEWPKMAIPNFFQNFSPKERYKFGMAKNGHSEFFLIILPKKTCINLEWPKMGILKLFKPF